MGDTDDVEKYVANCGWAADTKLDADPTETLCESYLRKEANQKTFQLDNPLELIEGQRYYSRKMKLFNQVVGFAKFSEYPVVAELESSRRSLQLQVLLDGVNFATGLFLPSIHLDEPATVSGNHPKVKLERDMTGLDGIALVNVVANPPETSVLGRKEIASRITHNDGSAWKPLSPPQVDSQGHAYDCDTPIFISPFSAQMSSLACPVCKKNFARPQDQRSHLTLKQDQKHQAYVHKQTEALSSRFMNTVDAVSHALNSRSKISRPRFSHSQSSRSHSSPSPSSGSQPFRQTIPASTVSRRTWKDRFDVNNTQPSELVDANTDDLDEDGWLDGDGSIVSEEEEELEAQERKDAALFELALDEAVQDLCGLGAEEVPDVFNFLPDLPTQSTPSNQQRDLDSELDFAPSFSAHRSMHRALEEDESHSWVWQWHPTAGKVYGIEPTVHNRWEQLFSGKDTNAADNYKPFSSRLEWELAQWAVKEKLSQKSFDRLLLIPQLKERLELSFNNARSMLNKVDEIPERCGRWYTKRLSFKDRPDEQFLVRHRNPVDGIKALWGDPAFSKDMVYKPGRLFRNSTQTTENRIFSEMWTSGYWNAVQEKIPQGGTVAPIIIASDKTQLTQFAGNKSAYPVYLTLGNIPKAVRRKPGARACVLIAYLSVDKFSKIGLSQTALKLRNYELFHRSMAVILEPLKHAGNPLGPGVEMVSGDGASLALNTELVPNVNKVRMSWDNPLLVSLEPKTGRWGRSLQHEKRIKERAFINVPWRMM
ncbi:hypothetical protein D9757_014448 [Collybiopsis confluens]|uniref:Sortilin N-terminal domain-containing protein n=1 Tax=Collybiopsis confluens TaxID=2823264 RepID=A0A8H5CUR4_9AGAR|nr:hypothetical protein D9757_014448 [Collybiopsis confluens]